MTIACANILRPQLFEFFLIILKIERASKLFVSWCQLRHLDSFLKTNCLTFYVQHGAQQLDPHQAISSWVSIIWITLIMLRKAAILWPLNIQSGGKKFNPRVLFFLLCFSVPRHLPLGWSCLNVKMNYLRVLWRKGMWLTAECVECACWGLLQNSAVSNLSLIRIYLLYIFTVQKEKLEEQLD